MGKLMLRWDKQWRRFNQKRKMNKKNLIEICDIRLKGKRVKIALKTPNDSEKFARPYITPHIVLLENFKGYDKPSDTIGNKEYRYDLADVNFVEECPERI